jgi:hypothetical protein
MIRIVLAGILLVLTVRFSAVIPQVPLAGNAGSGSSQLSLAPATGYNTLDILFLDDIIHYLATEVGHQTSDEKIDDFPDDFRGRTFKFQFTPVATYTRGGFTARFIPLTAVLSAFSQRRDGLAKLPGYYRFLFRLNPF